MKSSIVFTLIVLVNLNVMAQGTITSPLKPIVTIAPVYPPLAAVAKLEGFVDVEFTVDIDGSVINPIVINSEPNEIFNQAALLAIQKYKFSPLMVDNTEKQQVARQRISFKLQDNLDSNTIMMGLFATQKPDNSPFLALYALQIISKNTIKHENYSYISVVDKSDGFSDDLLVWLDGKEKINDYNSLAKRINKSAKVDFIKSHGAFKQFYQICTQQSCPPLSLSELNSLPYEQFVDFIKLKVNLFIDEKGNVESFRINKKPRKFKNIDALNKLINELKFIPATENYKPVKQTISVKIKAFATSSENNFNLWVKNKIYYLKKPPNNWVRVALLISKKGKVIDAKAIESSDKIYHAEAVNAIKKYKFSKRKSTYQLIMVVDFKPKK